MKQTSTDISTITINTIRCLAADAVQAANSGHPGAPMGMAPMAYVLWKEFLRHNPKNPSWSNRDRFVLSAGHASMLIYSLLHLTGYDLSLEDIKNFRQWGSKTPGHPEYGHTPGVEMTTGPLGQGFATAVGMAMAEKFLAAKFNQPNCEIVNHHTYMICSDGDLMEGLSHEASSMAGHLGLGKLIALYDDNKISIDGSTDLAFTENVPARFEAMGWHVQRVEDGNQDLEGIAKAIQAAKDVTDKPSIICVKTTIGYGSPNKQNSCNSHGAPLGEDEVVLAKKALGWPEDKKFYIPDDAKKHMSEAVLKGSDQEKEWNVLWQAYEKEYAALAEEFTQGMKKGLSLSQLEGLPDYADNSKAIATRAASGQILNALAKVLPNLVSGSADLGGSVNTTLKDVPVFSAANGSGRNFHYGVREHAMGAAVNGMTLHGGMIAACGTFLIFSDYMKPAIRLAALMKIPSIFLFSHDSVGLGEDGPTHQPIEQLASLRVIPNLVVVRPGDAKETLGAWQIALKRTDGPTVIVLSRQKLPILKESAKEIISKVERGGYVLKSESGDSPDLVLLATGSEVSLAVKAREVLEKNGLGTRVVSLPSIETFLAQDKSYRNMILPPQCTKRMSLEAGVAQGWHALVGDQGLIHSLDTFGASAPGDVVMEKFGFEVNQVVEKAMQLMEKR